MARELHSSEVHREGGGGSGELGERVGVGTPEGDEGALLEPQLRKGAV